MEEKTISLGIGFATGRKNFRKVLNAYIYGWNESKKQKKIWNQVELTLFVAYDDSYSDATSTDFTNLNQEMVDTFQEIVFIGSKHAQREVLQIVKEEVLSQRQVKQIFGSGYAGKRNAILYGAIEKKMDYLLFLDDDEYPVAVTKNEDTCLWSGQHVLPVHLSSIEHADITNGHHCGYISPIPNIRYDQVLQEEDFRRFIQAISNDIINWDSIKGLMNSGGVTYGNKEVLIQKEEISVREVQGCKFISGSNLCINLKDKSRSLPFYHPPGARGEDTFLSTLLTNRTVIKVPCYTFHDGFAAYKHVLEGVLPIELDSIAPSSEVIVTRFLNACIGWVRYKPLLLYLTRPGDYKDLFLSIQETLDQVVPKLCTYFQRKEFEEISTQFHKYCKTVEKHGRQFEQVQAAWSVLMKQLDVD
ncbi:MAG: hypothetical protein RR626_05000 [Anaerovoracaceae bacterium]